MGFEQTKFDFASAFFLPRAWLYLIKKCYMVNNAQEKYVFGAQALHAQECSVETLGNSRSSLPWGW